MKIGPVSGAGRKLVLRENQRARVTVGDAVSLPCCRSVPYGVRESLRERERE